MFDNDFPALMEDGPEPIDSGDPLFRAIGARGKCKVMCFSPNPNVTIPLMSVKEIKGVVDTWIQEMTILGAKYKWVQIFENKGSALGCSNPHPHCQIWASSFIPNEASVKDINLMDYKEKHRTNMLVDYAKKEEASKERLVVSNQDWLGLVPYWALWPYETMILPRRRHILRMTDLTDDERRSLADIMKQLTTKYDNLFECCFPYAMGFHGAPTGPEQETRDQSHWQFHAMYYPPLLR